jgi:hypothetical protein
MKKGAPGKIGVLADGETRKRSVLSIVQFGSLALVDMFFLSRSLLLLRGRAAKSSTAPEE